MVVGDGPWFWAAPFEQGDEFGGRGFPSPLPAGALEPRTKGAVRANTTLVVVATDATLTKAQAKRLAVMAQDGLARAIYPVHTPLDGDIVFAAATGRRPLADPVARPHAPRRRRHAGGRARDRPRRLRGDRPSGRHRVPGLAQPVWNLKPPRFRFRNVNCDEALCHKSATRFAARRQLK